MIYAYRLLINRKKNIELGSQGTITNMSLYRFTNMESGHCISLKEIVMYIFKSLLKNDMKFSNRKEIFTSLFAKLKFSIILAT